MQSTYFLRKSVQSGIVDVDTIQHRKLRSRSGGGIDAKRHIRGAAEVGAGELSILALTGYCELIRKKRLSEVKPFAGGNAVDPLLRRPVQVPENNAAGIV